VLRLWLLVTLGVGGRRSDAGVQTDGQLLTVWLRRVRRLSARSIRCAQGKLFSFIGKWTVGALVRCDTASLAAKVCRHQRAHRTQHMHLASELQKCKGC